MVAIIAILTRKMQKYSFASVLLWYSMLAVPSIIAANLIESRIKGESVMVFSYSASQYGWLLLTGVVNICMLSA